MCKSRQGNKTGNTWAPCYHLGQKKLFHNFPNFVSMVTDLFRFTISSGISISHCIFPENHPSWLSNVLQGSCTKYFLSFFKMSSYYQLCSFSHLRLHFYVQSFIFLIWFIYLFYFIFPIIPTCLFVESTGFGFVVN